MIREKYTFCVTQSLKQLKNFPIQYLGLELEQTIHVIKAKSIS
jgi:hypothetical protein